MESVILDKEASLEAAEKAKTEGNEFFKQGKYSEAVEAYSTAINHSCDSPKSAIYLSNRALCNIKIENYGLAIEDSEAAIKADPSYIKAYYRKGSAYFALAKYEPALQTFKRAQQLAPSDADITVKLKEVKKLFIEQQFALSIRVDDVQPSSKLKPEDISVPPTYDGPVYEKGDPITHEWVVKLLEYLRLENRFHKRYLWNLLIAVKDILKELPSLVDVPIPDDQEFTICGDVHGQYYDLLNIYKLNGYPSEKNPYLFNGDFVDRGSFSVEIVIALFAWKVFNPNCIYFNRGNHEAKSLNKIYGFEGEVKAKYCNDTLNLFSEVFCHLPICHVLKKEVMVVHGGLFAKDGITLDDIRKIDRVREPPEDGVMCDILWSDPTKQNGRHPSKRGVSMGFGPDVAKKFLDDNKLKYLVRSHEVKDGGYEVEADGRVITIFSAPNYCDQMKNKGAYIKLIGRDMTPKFTQFEAVPHPPVPPMKYAAGLPFF
jgi:serine/threonine-protein phosphatase 5